MKDTVKVSQSCPTLCNPMDYTVHGILQARILEWVAFPFSRGSSQSRDPTQVSWISGRFFTSWSTREAQEYWSGKPIPSPEDLPDPEIEPGSPALQVDSLATELSGKPIQVNKYLLGIWILGMKCNRYLNELKTQSWVGEINIQCSQYRKPREKECENLSQLLRFLKTSLWKL